MLAQRDDIYVKFEDQNPRLRSEFKATGELLFFNFKQKTGSGKPDPETRKSRPELKTANK